MEGKGGRKVVGKRFDFGLYGSGRGVRVCVIRVWILIIRLFDTYA